MHPAFRLRSVLRDHVRNNTVVYQDVGVFHNGVFTVTGDDSRSIFD